jgi:hypothetical protein
MTKPQTVKKLTSMLVISTLLISCAVRLTDDQRNQLKNELVEMVKVDQIASNLPTGKYLDYTKEQWSSFRDSVRATIRIRVEKMFDKYGFLGYNKVGKEGSYNFWLLVQHSDKHPEFQKRVLKAMNKELRKGNAGPGEYAYLYDRIKVKAGEKQKFGTQVSYDSAGHPFPAVGLIDSANVDKFRKAYNMTSLKDYYEMISNFQKSGK